MGPIDKVQMQYGNVVKGLTFKIYFPPRKTKCQGAATTKTQCNFCAAVLLFCCHCKQHENIVSNYICLCSGVA